MMPLGASSAASSGASGPAIGGSSLVMPPGLAISEVAYWSVDDVITYAKSLELGHLEGIIRREGMDGCTLLTDSAMQDLREAGMTNLQAKKLLLRLPMPGSQSWQ